MRLPTLRRARSADPGVITGIARLDRRTKRLVGRLRPGDVAVIDHVDLDRVAADSLVAVGVAAVLNAKPSISGRYPNLGPEVLLRAGIPLVDIPAFQAATKAAYDMVPNLTPGIVDRMRAAMAAAESSGNADAGTEA